MKLLLALSALIVPLSAAHAQTMSVATFLAKAEALQRKGPLALLSGDVNLLKAEVTKAGKELRAEQTAAQSAGRKPATCIPAKAAVNSNELLAHFRALPAAQRNVSVKAGFAGLMRRKYPCPA